MKKAVSNLNWLFFFTKYFGAFPFGSGNRYSHFLAVKKPQKSAQTCRSFLNANPIGAWSAFLLFSKKT
jgi:hypothetical protein